MKTYCSHCRRETSASKRARKVALLDVCGADLGHSADMIDCNTFAAGRRAAFKEVLKLAKASMSHAYGLDEFNRAIRSALKVKS